MTTDGERSRLQHLGDTEVEAVVELARMRLSLGRVRHLRPGDVLVTDRLAGERMALRINGVPFAEGETVVLNTAMACRVTGMVPLPVTALLPTPAVQGG